MSIPAKIWRALEDAQIDERVGVGVTISREFEGSTQITLSIYEPGVESHHSRRHFSHRVPQRFITDELKYMQRRLIDEHNKAK